MQYTEAVQHRNKRIKGVLIPRFLEVSVLTSKQGIEDPKQLATGNQQIKLYNLQ